MDEIVIEGKHYLSSRRAAEEIGYSQDYVTHLAREGMLDARMVGGLWFISRTALDVHKAQATIKAEEKADSNHEEHSHGPATLISFDGREYVSTARAADATGFTPDYIAQLAREGTVSARQVGNRWYVDLESVVAYKNGDEVTVAEAPVQESRHYVYEKDESDLMPKTHHKDKEVEIEHEPRIHQMDDVDTEDDEISSEEEIRIPIRIEEESDEPIRLTHAISTPPVMPSRGTARPRAYSRRKRSTIPFATMGIGAALTIVVVFSLGFSSLKNNATYAIRPATTQQAFAASVEAAFKQVGDVIEQRLVPELHYTRPTN